MPRWKPLLVAAALLALLPGAAAQETDLALGEAAAEVRAAVRTRMAELRDEVHAIRADVAGDLADARATYAQGRADARVAYNACLATAAEDAEARAACRATARAQLAQLRAEADAVKDELLSQLRLELGAATSSTCDAIALDVEQILVERSLQHLRLRAFVRATQLGLCAERLLADAAATDGAPTRTPVSGGVSVSVPVRDIAPTPAVIG